MFSSLHSSTKPNSSRPYKLENVIFLKKLRLLLGSVWILYRMCYATNSDFQLVLHKILEMKKYSYLSPAINDTPLWVLKMIKEKNIKISPPPILNMLQTFQKNLIIFNISNREESKKNVCICILYTW